MPDVTYTDRGWRGFGFPSADLFFLNLFSPSYGMYMIGPLLILGLLPAPDPDAAKISLPGGGIRCCAHLGRYRLSRGDTPLLESILEERSAVAVATCNPTDLA